MSIRTKRSTGKNLWHIENWYTKGDEEQSTTFQLDDSEMEFKIILRKTCPSIENIVAYRSLFLSILTKQPNIFGRFKFSICCISSEKIVTQKQASYYFDNKPPGEYFITKSVIHKDFDFVMVVGWIQDDAIGVPQPYSSNMFLRFSWLQESAEFSDVYIEAEDGTRIPVHKIILSARSRVFLAMLKSDMIEAKTSCIKIHDLSTQTVKSMISYMYTNCLPELSYDLTAELLMAADKYELEDLKEECGINIFMNINPSNSADMLLIADTYKENELKKNVVKYILKNRKKFGDPKKFDKLVESNPSLLADVTSLLAVI